MTERAYSQMHLGALLDLLERLCRGEISFFAYANDLSLLNSQLDAGVFFQ